MKHEIYDLIFTKNFLSNYWLKDSFHFKQAITSKPFLSSDLDKIIRSSSLTTSTVNVFKDGRKIETNMYIKENTKPFLLNENLVIDPLKLIKLVKKNHASLKIAHVERFQQNLQDLKKAFIERTKHYCSINLYYTPKGGTCFVRHQDPYDIFIFQIHGSKKWYLGKKKENFEEKCLKNHETDTEYYLNEGDVLYLPKDIPHYATCAPTKNSLHLTIGLHRPDHYSIIEHHLKKLKDKFKTEISLIEGGLSYDLISIKNEIKNIQIQLNQLVSSENILDEFLQTYLENNSEISESIIQE